MPWTTTLSQGSVNLLTSYQPWLGTLQLIAGAVWVGTLLSVSWLCGRSRVMADGPELGRLAQTLYRHWSTPALVVGALAAAPWGLGLDVTKWRWFLSALFVLGVALVVLHVSVGRQAKELARGEAVGASGGGMQRLFLLVSLVAFGALVMFRSHLTQ